MKIRILLLFVTFISLFACEKNDKETAPELSIDIVTGIDMTDPNGQAIGRLGNPNIKIGDIRIFPNPLIDKANVFTLDNRLTKIWITPGTRNTDFKSTDFEASFQNFTFSTEAVNDKKVMEFDLPAGDIQAVSLNLSNLETGYYRIFYQTKTDEIYWDNFFTDKESGAGDLISNLREDWK